MLRRVVVPLMLAGLITLSGLVLGQIYADPLLFQLVTGAAVLSVGAGTAARRLPSWTVAPLSVLLLAGYTIVTLRIAAHRAGLPGTTADTLTDALANGIPRLLTALIPVEPTPDTVIVPIVAAWLAGLAGTELALRNGRVLLGCAPALALYGGALYVIGPNADPAGWSTLAFAGLVLAGLTCTQPLSRTPDDLPAPTRAAIRARALVSAAAGLTVLVALIAVAGPWVSAQVAATPVDPRRYVEPPQVDSLDESPLNRISGWALAPKQPLFSVTTSGSSGASPGSTGASPGSAGSRKPVRLRLAVLPDFDGATWRVGATYRNAGRVLPAQPVLSGATVEQVRQTITVDELTGRLLPAVPTPARVEGARVAFDAATGTLIRPEGLTAGLSYQVVSDRQSPDLNLLPGADAPSGAAVARFVQVAPGAPEAMQKLADQLSDGNGAAFDRATAIEDFLAEHYRRVADAPSGHAYPNLEFFLFGPRDRGGQRGTSEQFAASFAVLARLTGLPSRVVVGFDAPARGGTVTGGDAIAWPEVLFEDLGWVAFDPMPKDKNPRPVEEDFTPKPSTPPPTSEPPPPPSTSASASTAPPAAALEPASGPPAALIAGGTSASVLLVLAAAAGTVVLMRRSQRRRRLTTGGPDDRITGAWYEFTDALRLAGRPVPAHLAAAEAATWATTPPPAPASRLRRAAPPPAPPVALPPIGHLVHGVNTTTFAPGEAAPDQADRAAMEAVAYAEALRAGRSWWRRAWWSIRPGPLRWHRGSTRTG